MDKDSMKKIMFIITMIDIFIIIVFLNIPLRRSRLSGKMETTCPDRRKPL